MRLIDADELMEHAMRDKLDSRELIMKMIYQAPTIKEIPTKIPIEIFEKLVSQESNINDLLDKIRDEVGNIDDDMVINPNSFYERKVYVRFSEVIKIIDKYKKESENKT